MVLIYWILIKLASSTQFNPFGNFVEKKILCISKYTDCGYLYKKILDEVISFLFFVTQKEMGVANSANISATSDRRETMEAL